MTAGPPEGLHPPVRLRGGAPVWADLTPPAGGSGIRGTAPPCWLVGGPVSVSARGPGGGLLLADELWLVGHDDRSGRARLHARALGLVLAAGLLAELVLWGRVDVVDGAVRVVRWDPPPEPLAQATLTELVAYRQHTEARTWLAFLAESAAERVAHRLVAGGHVERVRQRGLLGRSRVVFVPADANEAVWPEVRLERLLTGGEAMSEPDVVLAGLVEAAGLIEHVLFVPETRPDGLDHLAVVLGHLRPPLRHLVGQARAAVGDAVLAPR